ncbi:ABC transporter permease [Puia sp. P3]|uniref:ABC transporter permease n=1 Tax=Puia sp. P3 TaxID=3423952 RepID=UPI003D66FF25
MKKIIKYVVLDILRNRILVSYTVLLLAISLTLLCLEDNSTKALLSLLNIILIVLPLVSIIFSTIYYYNSAEFVELLVCQPLKRNRILLSIYTGLACSLLIAFGLGVGLPLLVFYRSVTALLLVLVGAALTVIFSALAVLGSVLMRDKARGIGVAILAWFYFSLLYDGLVLFLLFQLSDYPLEKPAIVLGALNPIDLGRIILLLRMDSSAMMGYTGAVFKSFFGSGGGMLIGFGILLVWMGMPLWLAVRRFNHKDL